VGRRAECSQHLLSGSELQHHCHSRFGAVISNSGALGTLYGWLLCRRMGRNAGDDAQGQRGSRRCSDHPLLRVGIEIFWRSRHRGSPEPLASRSFPVQTFVLKNTFVLRSNRSGRVNARATGPSALIATKFKCTTVAGSAGPGAANDGMAGYKAIQGTVLLIKANYFPSLHRQVTPT
jgi:hypothetical protein